MPKFVNQKCVHCLCFCKYLTEDHILPESWYPTNTPNSIEKWTVPACKKCNNKLGKIEEDLLLRLGMCVENFDNNSSGINVKIERMINPNTASDKQGYSRKNAALAKILNNIKPCVGADKCMLKNSRHWHEPHEGKMIRIPQKNLIPFIRKMARGLEYKLRGKLIETDRTIIAYRPTQNNLDDEKLFEKFEKRIASCLQTANCGPGFIINYGVNPYNDGNVIYKILIWGKYEFWAQIYPNSIIKKQMSFKI